MHLGDKGAGRVDHLQSPRTGFRQHGGRHAMRREQHHCAGRDVRQPLDKPQAARRQPAGHLRVVDNFMQAVDRATVSGQRRIGRGHGASHARAEAVRVRHDDAFFRHDSSCHTSTVTAQRSSA